MDNTGDSTSTRGRLGRLAFLFLAHALGTANITLVLAMAPSVEQSLGMGHAGFGMMVSCYYGAVLACAVPAGFVVDRLGIRLALACANGLFALGMWLFSMADGLALAAFGLMLCGPGYALVNPATARGVLAWFPPRGRATAMGAKQTGVPAGGVIAALVAAGHTDWRAMSFIFAAAMLLGAIGCFAMRVKEPASAAPIRLGDMLTVLRQPGLLTFSLGACFYAVAQTAFFAYLVLFAREILAADAAMASLCLGVAHIASATGRIGWGVISDRIPRNGRIVALVVCGVAGATGAVAMVVLPTAGGLTLLPLVAALLGFTIGGYAGITLTAAAESVDSRLTGAAIGFNMLVTNTGTMLGPLLFGLGVERIGYGPSWLLAALFVAIGAALFHLAGLRSRRDI